MCDCECVSECDSALLCPCECDCVHSNQRKVVWVGGRNFYSRTMTMRFVRLSSPVAVDYRLPLRETISERTGDDSRAKLIVLGVGMDGR